MTTDVAADALMKLENVLQAVLGTAFEEEVRAQTESERWYRSTIPIGELFRLWVRSRILDGADPTWVFSGLRMADRRQLFRQLHIEDGVIAAPTQLQHAELVLAAVGLPVRRSHGHRTLLAELRELAQLIEVGEDDRAASKGRQRAERFLRKVLYFYCAAGHGNAFGEILKDPGSLRLPIAFKTATAEQLPRLFTNDEVADLGFLALALRKLSSRLESAGVVGLSGSPLVLLGQTDYDTFSAFGSALQPYTHDKPSQNAARRANFAVAAKGLLSVVDGMAARNVVPDDGFVVETCTTIVGNVFRGITDDGGQVYYTCTNAPKVGSHILFLPSAACKYATCIWAMNPWH